MLEFDNVSKSFWTGTQRKVILDQTIRARETARQKRQDANACWARAVRGSSTPIWRIARAGRSSEPRSLTTGPA